MGSGRDLYFFIAGAGAEPRLKIFHRRYRGWAGINNFEMTGAGPGLEKLKMPGPGPSQDRIFFIAGTGPGFILFFIAGAGLGLKIFIAGSGLGRDQKFLNDRGGAGTGKI